MEEFKRVVSDLPDPRRRQGKRYSLESVVIIALMATVRGCDDAQMMQLWGMANRAWLSRFLKLPHGPPTQDVFLNVFAALDPSAFNVVFASWVQLLQERLGIDIEGKHIAIDGKTSRRSFRRDKTGKQVGALHTVSAWMSDAGLVLAQQKVDKKSNEITAIPELLKLVDIRGATISIDAFGCQKKVASTIIGAQGDYLLAVKGNQPTLHSDVKATFDSTQGASTDDLENGRFLPVEVYTTKEKGHGRLEERTISVCKDLSLLSTADNWLGLSFVAMVCSKRTIISTKKTSTASRYYVGSEAEASAKTVATKIRRHWGIENELHWVLDMAFREDEARHRTKNCAANYTTLRHFALNLLKLDKTKKIGIANKRKAAELEQEYLLQLLTGAFA